MKRLALVAVAVLAVAACAKKDEAATDTTMPAAAATTRPHAILAAIVPLAFLAALVLGRLPPPLIVITTGFWGLVNTAALVGFIARGWFGTTPLGWLRTTERRAAPAAS